MKTRIISLLIITLLLVGSTYFHKPSMTVLAEKPWEWKWEPYGPRTDTYLFKVILAYESRLAAFEADEIDMVGVLPTDIERIRKNRPDAFFLETQSYTTYPLQFNLRRWPISHPAVRKAFAHMIDREGYVIPEVMKGYGTPLYTIAIPLLGDWVNYDVKTYEYNLKKAEKILDEAGFKRGPDGWRVDPTTNQPLKVLELDTLPEATSPIYYGTALHVAKQAEKIGLRISVNVVAAPLHSKKVHEEQNFDMYFVGWTGLGPYPDWLWYFFHSKWDYEGGWNEWGVRNSTLDRLLDEFYYTLDLAKARVALHKAQILLQDIVPWVSVASPIGITAISGRLRGLVLQKVPGAPYPAGASWLSDLDTHFVGAPLGGVFRVAIGQPVGTLNPGTYLWSHEHSVLTYVYDFLTLSNPENVYDLMPRLAEKWSVEEIEFKSGVKGTKVTISLVKNATWQDGIPFTASDVDFTIWKVGKEWRLFRYDSVEAIRNIYKTELPDPYTISMYVNATSWLFWLDLISIRPLPKHIWEKMTDPKADPSKVKHPTNPVLTNLLGTGPFIFKEHVPGSHIVHMWNPTYFMRHPEKGLILEKVRVPKYEDDPHEILLRVLDYAKRPVVNASVTVDLTSTDGNIRKHLVAEHVANDTYLTKIAGVPSTSYTVKVRAEQTLYYGTLVRTETISMTIEPTWKRYVLHLVIAIAAIAMAVILAYRTRKKRLLKH